MKLGQLATGKDNNFNLLRHVAAAMVIFTHSYGLTSHEEPFKRLTGISLAYVAVNVFFVLSGFLITASWIRNPRLSRYLISRIARIYPALWVSVALCLFVIGPIFTTLPLQNYFLHRDFFIFAAENTTLILKGVYHQLPGLFSTGDHKAVNESLWTLPYELWMYMAVLVVGLARAFKYRSLVIVLFAALAILYIGNGTYNIFVIQDKELVRLGACFAGGSMLYLYKDQVPLSYMLVLLMLCLVVFGYGIGQDLGTNILFIVLPYITLVLAYLPGGQIRQFNRLGDYSYGLYIYAYPIQQVIANLGVHDTYMHMFLAYAFTLIIAMMSWHYVESPVLKRAKGSSMTHENVRKL